MIALLIVANTLITIYLYPTQRPDYWWLPGAWIWFQVYDRAPDNPGSQQAPANVLAAPDRLTS